MRYFRVVGLEQRQHYKTRDGKPRPLRGLSWLKLATERLDDLAFAQLPDQAKAHVILIELLAARAGNFLPFDEKFIRARINASTRVNLPLLMDHGFIEPASRDSLGEHAQASSTEQRSEAERSGEIAAAESAAAPPVGSNDGDGNGRTDGGPVERIISTWAACFRSGRPAVVTPAASKAVEAALNDYPESMVHAAIRGGARHREDFSKAGKVFDDLTNLLRFPDRIERWAREQQNAEADLQALQAHGPQMREAS